ncbi:RNA pseudouridine synthase [Aerococcaceae bacterium DSM 111176]|nr:RNA pseudouridine synthase [Aerococcaceae bacterium DSM 111176]
MKVIYQDNHLFIVEKQPNQLVQGDATSDKDLLTEGKEFIKTQDNKPGNVFLGLVHRLDRPVGGAIVFAKTSKAASRLSDQLRHHAITRKYLAITDGSINQESGKLTDYLYKDRSKNQSYVVDSSHKEAKKAILNYRVLATENNLSLLEVELETGRPHQIRVQLSHAGMPIVGDQKYHPNPVVGQQIALWAYTLGLDHPTLKESMAFTSLPNANEYPWNTFKELLKNVEK